MRNLTVAALFVVSTACATTHPTPYRTQFTGDSIVEARPLPPDPASVDLSKYPGDESHVVALEAGMPSPFAGILVDERRAARDWTYRESYIQLRSNYEGDQKELAAQRRIYEEQLNAASKQIESLQPTWWSTHKFEVGFIGGLILGVVVPVAIIVH